MEINVSFLKYFKWFFQKESIDIQTFFAQQEGPGNWREFRGPLGDKIPRGRSSIVQAYGDPRAVSDGGKNMHWDQRWEGKNLKTYRDFPGYGGKPIRVHNQVEPYLREALRRVQIACPEYKLDKIGCFSPRFTRHNPDLPLSKHTWAIAIDINPRKNKALSRNTMIKKFSKVYKPFEEGWEKISDLPEELVECFESVGWRWGGRWRNFIDPMHFELN